MTDGLLSDCFEDTLLPLLRLLPLALFQDGIFSPSERMVLAKQKPEAISTNRERPAEFFQHFGLRGISGSYPPVNPATLITALGEKITGDISLLHRDEFSAGVICEFLGAQTDIWISNSAQLQRLVFLDATDGPIIIGAGARISAFSHIKGPAYIGPGSRLDRCFFQESRCGTECRLGGEIANTLIGSYSNKHHEGFLGHSLVGNWVNLGALTTTSDLKNNYGEVRLTFRDGEYPTGTLKFGSILGDFVKTSIGTLLNTGTILDAGTVLFAGAASRKYYPPFFWGGNPAQKYEIGKFLKDTEKIMARRSCNLSDFDRKTLMQLSEQSSWLTV